MRSLATVQEISDIKPIVGADAIELVLIKGCAIYCYDGRSSFLSC